MRTMIQYREQELQEATIIGTSKRRIWYCFSNMSVNYDLEAIRIYKNGSEVKGLSHEVIR